MADHGSPAVQQSPKYETAIGQRVESLNSAIGQRVESLNSAP